VESVGLVELVESVASVELVGLAASAVGTGRQLFPLAAEVPAIGGSTIRNIAAAHPIEIVPPRTGLEVRRVAILLLTARPAPADRLADRAAIWPATAGEGAA
jgi:hypothetical protein